MANLCSNLELILIMLNVLLKSIVCFSSCLKFSFVSFSTALVFSLYVFSLFPVLNCCGILVCCVFLLYFFFFLSFFLKRWDLAMLPRQAGLELLGLSSSLVSACYIYYLAMYIRRLFQSISLFQNINFVSRNTL